MSGNLENQEMIMMIWMRIKTKENANNLKNIFRIYLMRRILSLSAD
jgi:hypothetical protein